LTEARPIILVTGASGFVGSHLTPALAGEWRVRRVLRTPSGTADEVLVETIGPATEWGPGLRGVETVIHLAARVHRQNEDHEIDLYRDINTEGTLHLARSAANAGVRQFVFVSTVLVNGRSNDGRLPFSEDDILTPRGVYGMSKAAAEKGLSTLAQDCDMRVTIIRPPLIYGAGAKGNFNRLVKAVKLGIPLPFAAVRNRRAFLSVENLASFIVHRLSHTDNKFELFLLADKEQVSTPDFIRRLAMAAGIGPRLFPMPTSVLSALLRISGQADAHESVLGSLELNTSRAAATGWRPPVSLDEGLRHAMAGMADDD
jgi:UDP-glucose 4-epimerase